MKKLVLLFSFLFFVSFVNAQTNLSAGDIAIIGFNFDNPDEWAFVPMVDLTENTEIKFTDNGWLAIGSFRSGEGTVTWTAPTGGIEKGNVITINNDGGWATTNGSVTSSGSIFLSATGDQILAYQGDDSSPTFAYALNSEGTGWQADATSSNTSALPTGLTNGTSAIALNEIDNSVYDESVTSGSQAELLSAISNTANWSGSNTVRQTMPSGPFNVGGAPSLAISNVSRQYPVPTSAQTCYVQCDITGGTAPYTALIKYDVDGVPQTDISMSNTGGDTYQGTIPAQSDGARIEYYIHVTDAARATETSSIYKLFWGTSNISNAAGNIKAVDGNGVMSYDGYYARVTGVATVASGVYSTSNLEVYLQDSYGGINLYKGGSTVTVTEGNSYTVYGVLDQFNGKTEIIPNDASTDITDNGAGTMPSVTIKTVAQLLAAPETYEGMLIGIQHLSKQGGTWGANQNLTMTDDGGTNTFTLRIDGDTDLDENTEPTWPKDVVGIMGQYDNSSPYTSGYQTLPRRYTDIWNDGALPITLTEFTAAVILNEFVLISWTTESESNMSHFNLFRDDLFIYQQYATNTTETVVYEFVDTEIEDGETYSYLLEAVELDGSSDTYGPYILTVEFGEEGENPDLPEVTFLRGNYPNPFNPSTTISFNIKEGEVGTLSIYNIKGQVLESREFSAGIHDYEWFADEYDTGVYFYKLESNSHSEVKKMLILK